MHGRTQRGQQRGAEHKGGRNSGGQDLRATGKGKKKLTWFPKKERLRTSGGQEKGEYAWRASGSQLLSRDTAIEKILGGGEGPGGTEANDAETLNQFRERT